MPNIPLHIPWDRYEMRQDLDGRADLQAVYQGFAAPEIAQTEERWTIFKYSFDANGFITRRQVVFKKAWSNRATSFP